jgi:murein DD-endopeptidase MepM/ murein hydrolase activator NlpD
MNKKQVTSDIGVLLLAGMFGIGLLFSACQSNPGPAYASVPVKPVESDTTRSLTDLYGIPLDLYTVKEGTVGRNQTLSDLLQPLGISLQEIYQVSLLPDSLINERRIKQGNRYLYYSRIPSAPEHPLYAENIFIYEKDPLNFVAIQIDPDTLWAFNGTKPVETRLQFASGTIETSLWESMFVIGANPMLAVELSEIYAWSIDFFELQQGDRYKVIYEESFVDSASLGIDRIMGAWFFHNDYEFWAIPFVQDSVRSFFDEEGNSLRKAFLKAPLRYSRISSGFSNSRYHPVLKIRRPHHGVDYAAPTGTPVHTVGDGVITDVGYQKGGGGNYVKIKHNSVYSTTYMHLSGFGKGVRRGVYVKQGDVIGYVGSSGLATGPHLDFRFYKNGSAVNPLKVEAPPVEPVFEKNRQAFAIIRVFTINWLKLLQ